MDKPILQTKKQISYTFVLNNELYNPPMELLPSSCLEENSFEGEEAEDSFEPKYCAVESVELETFLSLLNKIKDKKGLFLNIESHPLFDEELTLTVSGHYELNQLEKEEAERKFEKEMALYNQYLKNKKEEKEQRALANKRKQLEKLKKELGE